MRLKLQQLDGALKKLAPVYFVSGDEPLQLGEAADAIRNTAKKGGFNTREIFSADTGFEWNEVFVAADSMSIFADKTLIDVRLTSSTPGAEGAKAIIRYCKDLPEDTLLIMTAPKLASASLKSKWCQSIESVGVIVQVWPLNGVDLIQWLQRRAQKRGLDIDSQAIKFLASRVEGNLLAAVQEIEKLYVLFGEKSINKQALEELIANNARFDVFKLTDCLLAGRPNRAIKILNGLQSEGIAAPVVLWALAREIRILFNIKLNVQLGKSKDEVFRSYRLWDKRKQLIGAAVSRLEIAELEKTLLLCGIADRQIKGQEQGDCWETLLLICMLF